MEEPRLSLCRSEPFWRCEVVFPFGANPSSFIHRLSLSERFHRGPGGAFSYGNRYAPRVEEPDRHGGWRIEHSRSFGEAPLGERGRARTLYFIAAAVLAALVPLILFAGLWVRALLNQSERDVQTYLGSRAATLSARLDAEIEEEFSVLRAVASVQSLDEPDLATFQTTATRMVSAIPQWSMLALIDPASGRPLLNTRGSPPETSTDAAEVARQVAEQRQPKVVTRFGGSQGAVSGNSILLYLPVIRDDTVRYVLVAAMRPDTVQQLLMIGQEPNLLTVVLDEQDRILARSRGLDQYLGQTANEQLREGTRGRQSGLLTAQTIDGQHVVTVFRRSPVTGWLAVAATDRQQVLIASERSNWALIVTGVLSLTLAGVLAVFLFYNVMERRVSDERLAASRALGELDARLLSTTQEALSEQRKAASEREVLLREIYHRVKNNLQIIQSLLQLGSRNLVRSSGSPSRARSGASAPWPGCTRCSTSLPTWPRSISRITSRSWCARRRTASAPI